MEDLNQEKRNAYYYNQILEKNKKGTSNKKPKVKSKSFGTQKIDIKDYLYVPEGMEFIVYSLYFVFIPYIAGIIFLFFAVAGADFDNFMLLNLTQALIVWAIGYEIVATLTLTWIFVLFIKYDDTE